MSILLKYSLWLGAVLLVVSGAIISAALWSQDRALTEQALLRGQSIAVNIAAPAADALLRKNDLLLITLTLSATQDHPQVAYAAILDQHGLVKGHPDRAALGHPLAFEPKRPVPDAPPGATVLKGLAGKAKVWDISVPIRLKGTDKVLGTVHVGLQQAGVDAAVRASLWKLAGISLLLLALGVGLLALAVRVAVRPLSELAGAALRVGHGRFDTRVPVRGHDELGHLAETFNQMAEGLERAEQARGEHQRIESELALARQIQVSLLPAKPPQLERAEIAFRCVPAKELGGDFYDCIPLQSGAWGLLIADVSGKGVPAALNVVNLRNLFRVVAPGLDSPAETLKRVNALAFPDLRGESFVTLIYAVLRPDQGRLSLVGAGHEPLLWLKAAGGLEAVESTAPPVGLAEPDDFDPDVQELALELAPGDRLLFFTDGVTEAMDSEGRQYGQEALQACAAAPGSASETVLRVADAVSNHAGGEPASDDVTLLALRWKG